MRGRAARVGTTGAAFVPNPALADEFFGAASIVIRCADKAEVARVLEGLEGQLTATLQLDDEDVEDARALLAILERKAGRILANGWPNGVEVSYAMVHGGPFPATSESRTTTVGTAATERVRRPAFQQDLPEALPP